MKSGPFKAAAAFCLFLQMIIIAVPVKGTFPIHDASGAIVAATAMVLIAFSATLAAIGYALDKK